MLSAKQGASSTIFWVFGITRPEIESRSPGPLANTILIRLLARLKDKYSSGFPCETDFSEKDFSVIDYPDVTDYNILFFF